MDKGQFNGYLGPEGVKNPQKPTRDKLTKVVGIEIKKKGREWILKDPIDEHMGYDNLKKELTNRVEDQESDFSLPDNARDQILSSLLDDIKDVESKIRRLIEIDD